MELVVVSPHTNPVTNVSQQNKIFTSYKASTGPRQQKKAKVKIKNII
jgi:hypothetical protein